MSEIKPIKFTEKQVEKLYHNEDYDEEKGGRFNGPKGYEGWYITTDTDTGDFDSEKGSLYDYEIYLFNDKSEFMGTAIGGYYNAVSGENFYGSHTFNPPEPETPESNFINFLMEIAEDNLSMDKMIKKIENRIKKEKNQ